MKKLIVLLFVIVITRAFGQSCADLKESYDKFTEVKTLTSPEISFGEGSLKNRAFISFMVEKRILKKEKYYIQDTLFYLAFMGTTADYSPLAKGMIILLENDNKIEDLDLDYKLVETTNVADIYLGKLLLNDEMIEVLRKNIITDIRVFAFNSLSSDDIVAEFKESKKISFYLNCLFIN